MKFIISDSDYQKEFCIEYMQESFISVKKELNKENAIDIFPSFSIIDLEQIIVMLKTFVDAQ